MLTKEQLVGMWVSVPTEWDEEGNFDEKTFRDEVALLIDTGVHGLYTTGTTGEFYAMDWKEWTKVQDAFLAETAGKIPVQVGANWFNTRDTIKRMRYARDKGADAVQICFPGWMEMRQEDYDQFLVDCSEAVPDIAIIHYILTELGSSKPLVKSSSIVPAGKSNEMLIDICKKMRADRFLSGSGGPYMDSEKYEREGITVFYQHYRCPQYPQLHGHFEQNLSVIDLLFNCGSDTFDHIMKDQETYNA